MTDRIKLKYMDFNKLIIIEHYLQGGGSFQTGSAWRDSLFLKQNEKETILCHQWQEERQRWKVIELTQASLTTQYLVK